MKVTSFLIALLATTLFAENASIDLSKYKTNKNYLYAETTYTLSGHGYTLVNIKPATKGDTVCISAVVIDKRKFVMFDVGGINGPYGLFVPATQPLKNGFIILKASPNDSKTFMVLPNGKMVTLPGAQSFVDTTERNIYCIWNTGNDFRLTIFNYKTMRIILPTITIKQPQQWYSSGATYYFSVAQEEGYYSIELLAKSVYKTNEADNLLSPVPYLIDFGKIKQANCCGGETLRW